MNCWLKTILRFTGVIAAAHVGAGIGSSAQAGAFNTLYLEPGCTIFGMQAAILTSFWTQAAFLILLILSAAFAVEHAIPPNFGCLFIPAFACLQYVSLSNWH